VKLFLDESVDVKFRSRLTGHNVYTIAYMGWKSLKNGRLLAEAVREGFNAIISTDRGMANQLNLAGTPIAIVILHGATNRLRDLDKLVPELLKALNHLTPGTFVHVRP
jgi:predicted nuclease of predicted toxin-antitoxin system